MNYGRIAHLLATLGIFLALAMGVPLAVAAAGSELNGVRAFAGSAGILALLGLAVRRMTARAPKSLHRRDAILAVAASWMLASLIGAVPYVACGAVKSPLNALFESTSGFTTTGSTALTALESLPRSLLLWRSMTHWLGGLGVVLLVVLVLPAAGVGGRFLRQVEAAGVDHDDLRPRARETALALAKIYTGITVSIAILLLVAGLGVFDALLIALGTAATGSFVSHDDPGRFFSSTAVVIVVAVGMVLAGGSFGLYARVRREGFRVLWRDSEFRSYLAILAVAAAVVVLQLGVAKAAPSIGEALETGVFHAVSMATSTGHATGRTTEWPDAVRLVFLLLVIIGGCEGSSAGGLKVSRVILLVRVLGHEIRRFIRPHRVSAVLVGGSPVSTEAARTALVFIALYAFMAIAGTFVLAGLGVDLRSAGAASISTLGNAGSGAALLGASTSYAEFPALGKGVLCLMMLFGRLELFAMLAVFLPSLYKN